MGLRERNRVTLGGEGRVTLMFAHGVGCDQNMWRFLAAGPSPSRPEAWATAASR